MDTSASPTELQEEEDLDTISAGKGVAIGGSVLQTIDQSKISNFMI
jgi:hypothetical protein